MRRRSAACRLLRFRRHLRRAGRRFDDRAALRVRASHGIVATSRKRRARRLAIQHGDCSKDSRFRRPNWRRSCARSTSIPAPATWSRGASAERVPFRVLSDGFDRNLDRLQQLHGVRFAYDANGLRYEDGVWRLTAHSPDPSCGCGTGTCKRARIAAFRAQHPGVPVVHIGNGRVSDICGAVAADASSRRTPSPTRSRIARSRSTSLPFATSSRPSIGCSSIRGADRPMRTGGSAVMQERSRPHGRRRGGRHRRPRGSVGASPNRALPLGSSSARRAPGGRARSESVEGFTLEAAGPVLSTGDRRLLSWIDEVGLRDELLPLRPVVTIHCRGDRVASIDPRGLFSVRRIPGVRPLQALRLVRLPRLVARYGGRIDPEAPERAADLDDRSLGDFGRLLLRRQCARALDGALRHRDEPGAARQSLPLISCAATGRTLGSGRACCARRWESSRRPPRRSCG